MQLLDLLIDWIIDWLILWLFNNSFSAVDTTYRRMSSGYDHR